MLSAIRRRAFAGVVGGASVALALALSACATSAAPQTVVTVTGSPSPHTSASTEKDSVRAYLLAVKPIRARFNDALGRANDTIQNAGDAQTASQQLTPLINEMGALEMRAAQLNPPSCMRLAHRAFLGYLRSYCLVLENAKKAYDTGSQNFITMGQAAMMKARDYGYEYRDFMEAEASRLGLQVPWKWPKVAP